ncbi:hypothetical protein [Rhizobium leguminosarum]|uniref:hypothetical protein n=1 Tax=Rhizobium leguminosarum TaxID=384 RepID=UPI001D359FFF|nr:hypothetical protein [Rhizobium leguminosarum]MBP2449794.1 hypothetical protein [Rhizobium leguminosarum]
MSFFDPLCNVDYARDLHRSNRLKGEMVSLMQRAEAWGRAEVAADRVETSAAGEEPSDSIATMSFAGAPNRDQASPAAAVRYCFSSLMLAGRSDAATVP